MIGLSNPSKDMYLTIIHNQPNSHLLNKKAIEMISMAFESYLSVNVIPLWHQAHQPSFQPCHSF